MGDDTISLVTPFGTLAAKCDANADRADSFAVTTHESNMLEGTSVECNEAAYNARRAPEPYSQSWNEAVLERLELEQAVAASLLTATMP